MAFGNNYKGRLGLGHSSPVRTPTRVTAGELGAPGVRVAMAACGDAHSACVLSDGRLLTWGHGPGLGRATEDPGSPGCVGLPGRASYVDAEHQSTACVVGGHAYAWGANAWGQLGVGDSEPQGAPCAYQRPGG